MIGWCELIAAPTLALFLQTLFSVDPSLLWSAMTCALAVHDNRHLIASIGAESGIWSQAWWGCKDPHFCTLGGPHRLPPTGYALAHIQTDIGEATGAAAVADVVVHTHTWWNYELGK